MFFMAQMNKLDEVITDIRNKLSSRHFEMGTKLPQSVTVDIFFMKIESGETTV